MFCVPMKGTAGRRKGLKLPSIIKKRKVRNIAKLNTKLQLLQQQTTVCEPRKNVMFITLAKNVAI